MNSRSSRSHAIFTITLEQQKQASTADDTIVDCDEEAEESREKEMEDDFLTAKMLQLLMHQAWIWNWIPATQAMQNWRIHPMRALIKHR